MRLEPLPAAACAALAAGLIAQFILPASEAPPEVAVAVMRMPRLVAPPRPPDYRAILEAPIFSPDRKPGPDADAAPGASLLDDYAALGVAIGRGFATAVVKGPDGASKTLRLGGDLEGWRLIGLDRGKLTFQKNDARHVLVVGSAALQAGAGDKTASSKNGNDDE